MSLWKGVHASVDHSQQPVLRQPPPHAVFHVAMPAAPSVLEIHTTAARATAVAASGAADPNVQRRKTKHGRPGSPTAAPDRARRLLRRGWTADGRVVIHTADAGQQQRRRQRSVAGTRHSQRSAPQAVVQASRLSADRWCCWRRQTACRPRTVVQSKLCVQCDACGAGGVRRWRGGGRAEGAFPWM